MTAAVRDLGGGIWTWTGRHPEWHPGVFGAKVRSYAVRNGDHTLLIDPLVLTDEVWSELDGIVAGPVSTVITIGYHVRSSEAAQSRYGGLVYGPAAVAKRLRSIRSFRPYAAGDHLPFGAVAHPVGNPRRQETPLELPAAGALVFGDAVVEAGGELKTWIQAPLTEKRLRWYQSRFRPSIEPLADLGVSKVLVTHGRPVLEHGSEALRAAFDRPWYHRPV